MNLGFDIDEVVVDITGSLLDFIYYRHGLARNISVFENYGFHDCEFVLKKEWNTKIAEQMVELVHSNTFLYGLNPVHFAVETINTLRLAGHKLHFITARKQENKDVTHEWFNKTGVPYDSISMVNGMSKGEIADNLGLDMFVDDLTVHLDSIASVNKNIKLLLLDKPWNLCYNNKKVKRVLNWYNILGEINEYTSVNKK